MIKKILLIITVLLVTIAPIASQTALALSPEQRLEIERRPWYDPTDTVCDSSSPGSDASQSVNPGTPPDASKAQRHKVMPSDTVNTGDTFIGTASTYGNDPKTGFKDDSDNNEPKLSGASNDNPGIAVYNNGTLGGWWNVLAPNGKNAILQQTDEGPSVARLVDINAVAARAVFGYPSGQFPTDQGDWVLQYMGKTKPAGAIDTEQPGTDTSAPSQVPGQAPSTPSSTASGKVYMIGDSITHGTQTQLDTALKGVGYSSTIINGVDSRSLSEGGSPLNGITVFSNDKDKWKDASSIIIELGTNGGLTANNIGKMMTVLQQGLVSPSTKVYWVNIGVINAKRLPFQSLDDTSWNKALSDNASKGYTVIDWASVMKDHPEYIANDTYGVHPTGPGIDVFAKTVADGSKNLNTTAPMNTSDLCCDSGLSGANGPATPLTGADNAQKIFNFLIQKGLTAIQAVGVMGNLMAESSLNPKEVEGGWNFPPESDTVPPSVGPRDQPGYGIVQWTSRDRKAGLSNAAQQQNRPVYDLSFQLDYMWYELTSKWFKSAAYDPLTKATTIESATQIFQEHFEVGAGYDRRLGFAQNFAKQPWAQVGGTVATAGSTDSTGSDSNISQSTPVASCNGSGGSSVTGTGAAAIVAILLQEMAGGANSVNGDKSYLKYTDGVPDAERGGWCADFTSWVMKQAGVPFTGGASGGWRLPTVSGVKDFFVKKNAYHPARQGYVPQPGDVVIHTHGGGDLYHVNIVLSVDGQKITTIGGNESNKIGKWTIAYDSNDIDGFGTPGTQ